MMKQVRTLTLFDLRSVRFRMLAPLLLAAACAPAAVATGEADPVEAARLQEATRPAATIQVFFDWNLEDREANFTGRGVLRLDADRRGRVDLFGPRGETYAAAILQGEDLRAVPPAALSMLPPPALLWSALGVFRAPTTAPLTGTGTADGRTTLEYRRDGTLWRFGFENDRLRSTEWTDGAGRRTVELSGSADAGLPAQSVFRDWTQFRQLTLRVTEVEEIAGFEPDVWILPGER